MVGHSFPTHVVEVTFIFANYWMFEVCLTFYYMEVCLTLYYMGNTVITISVLILIGFFQIIYLGHSSEMEL